MDGEEAIDVGIDPGREPDCGNCGGPDGGTVYVDATSPLPPTAPRGTIGIASCQNHCARCDGWCNRKNEYPPLENLQEAA